MIRIKGRGAVKGVAEGYAIVAPNSIQGWAGVNDMTGEIIEKGHVEEGEYIKDKILVLPGSKGSNGWSGHFNATKINNVGPAGWIFTKLDSRAGVAGAVLDIPMVVDLEQDPFELIETGDWIKVDGDKGIVEIKKIDK